jgi:predicted ester cyclase
LPEDGAQSHVEAYKDGVRETREAFPDFGIVIEKVVYEGDTVAALALLGYPHGPDGDLEPTGRGARTRGITLVRVTEGRISDLWKQDDAHTVPRQLGLEPC